MKFIMHYHIRRSPTDDAQNVKLAENLQQAFSAWTPPEGMQVEQILVQVDGRGGFAIVETEDEATITMVVSQFQPWFDWDVHLVQDVMQHGVGLGAGTAWARETTG
ncbi:MAG: DUF3303 family protein [Actinomycetota bacterium]